jgi:hypothetical protein
VKIRPWGAAKAEGMGAFFNTLLNGQLSVRANNSLRSVNGLLKRFTISTLKRRVLKW